MVSPKAWLTRLGKIPPDYCTSTPGEEGLVVISKLNSITVAWLQALLDGISLGWK